MFELAAPLMTGGSAQGGQAGGGGGLLMLLPLLIVLVIMYVLMIRPQQKRQKEHQEMLASIRKGDRVLLVGGIIGDVMDTKESEGLEVLVLKISDGTKVEASRGHVQQILKKNR